MPEIIDPWGRPYEFIRDPIGLDTPAIKNYVPAAAAANQYPIDPDPLDFLISDWRYDVAAPSLPAEKFYPIYLPPVVISAGADGEFDLRRSYYKDDNEVDQGVNYNYSTAIINWNSSALGPFYPDPYNASAVLPYRFPDPYYNVSAIAYSAPADPDDPTATPAQPYEISNSDLGQVDLAKQGGRGANPATGGLAGFISNDGYDASADNISSLDGGF